jgi:hypothetical protein
MRKQCTDIVPYVVILPIKVTVHFGITQAWLIYFWIKAKFHNVEEVIEGEYCIIDVILQLPCCLE